MPIFGPIATKMNSRAFLSFFPNWPLQTVGNDYPTKEPPILTESQLILNTKAYQHWLL